MVRIMISIFRTLFFGEIPLSKVKLPKVTSSLVSRLKLIINIELIGFALIPFLATLMARGIGLVEINF